MPAATTTSCGRPESSFDQILESANTKASGWYEDEVQHYIETRRRFGADHRRT